MQRFMKHPQTLMCTNPVSCHSWTLKNKVRSEECENVLLHFNPKQHWRVLDVCKAVNSQIHSLTFWMPYYISRVLWIDGAYMNFKTGALVCTVVVTVTTIVQNKGNLGVGTDGFPYSVWLDRATRVRSASCWIFFEAHMLVEGVPSWWSTLSLPVTICIQPVCWQIQL